MTVKNKNFSGLLAPDIIDTEYFECNFSHRSPIEVAGVKVGVRIFPDDDTPRTFTRCNLVNTQVPPNSVVIKCNTTIRESQVLIDIETITIDGSDIVLNNYADRIYGNADGLYQTPKDLPIDRIDVEAI